VAWRLSFGNRRTTPVRLAVQVGRTSLLPPRCYPLPGSSSGSSRWPLARSIPERTARCEPPRLGSTPELLPFIPADSTAFSRSVHMPPGTEVPEGCACRPPIDLPLQRPLPRPTRKSRASASKFHLRSLAPPSWFRTTSTVSSAAAVAGLLHPAADPEVHRVSVPSFQPSSWRLFGTSPRCRTCPSKNSPRQPLRVTAVVASLPFVFRPPPRRSPTVAGVQDRGGRVGTVGFEALLRLRVWCLPSSLPTIGDPLLPGLCSSSRFTSPAAGDPSPTARPGFRSTPERVARYLGLRFAPGEFHGRSRGPSFVRPPKRPFEGNRARRADPWHRVTHAPRSVGSFGEHRRTTEVIRGVS